MHYESLGRLFQAAGSATEYERWQKKRHGYTLVRLFLTSVDSKDKKFSKTSNGCEVQINYSIVIET